MSDTIPGKGQNMINVNYSVYLSKYSVNELLVLLDHGIISVTEYETELHSRGLNPDDQVKA